jgi:uncharacterized protein involved in outer membrane biogenesis
MRWVKIAGGVLAVVVLLVVAFGLALYVGGGKALAWVIEHPGSTLIGRQIRIGGPVTVAWGSPTRIVIEDLHVANASWDAKTEMLAAGRVELAIMPLTLLHGPTRIPLLRLDKARLLLETSAEGQGNWSFGNGAPKKRQEFPMLQHFEVQDGALFYRNGKTKAETDVGFAALRVDAPDAAGPVKIAGTGTFQHQPIRLAATVGPIAQLRDTNQPYPVALDAALADLRLQIDGKIAKPLDFSGLDLRLSLGGTGLDKLGDALGVPLPELPPIRGTSKLGGGNGSWQLNAVSLKVGKSDLEGGIGIDTNEKVPRIDANFTSSFIDLADFKGMYGGKPENAAAPQAPPAKDGRVIPDTKLSVSKLPGINAALKFYGTKIEAAAGLPIERVTLGLAIENGELGVDPLQFHVALGDLALQAHYNPFTASSPPRLRAKIDLRKIDLHNLLSGPTMPQIARETAGTLGGLVNFDAIGASLRQFLASMNGEAEVFVANGQMSALLQRLAPIDVLGALGVYLSGDRPQPIDCFVSRFDLKSGVATASTLLMKTPSTTIVGSGGVNFRDEAIDLALKPYNNGFRPISLHTPIDISGTLGKPDFHVETENVIAKLGAAIGLGVLFPPAALLPLIDTGLGDKNTCAAAYAGKQPPAAAPQSGSSTPKR